jgi:uncharacterized delta-60 repeat protein
MSRRVWRTAALLAAATAAFALAVASAGAAPGDLDPSFGRNGFAYTPNSSAGRALALQQNGRIVAVGEHGDFADWIEIDRYFPDGDIDPTFGNGGRARVLVQNDGCSGVLPAAVEIDSMGRIVIAGVLGDCDSSNNIVVVRVLRNGDLDTSFGDQGIVVLDPGGRDGAIDLRLRPDGSILVGGYVGYRRQRSPSAFIVARLDDQGALEPGYGEGGTAIVPLRHRNGLVAAMDVDAKGRAVLVETSRRVRVIRLTRGGELDDSFSGDGSRALNLGRRGEAFALAAGKRGRIYVGGSVAKRKPRRTWRTNLALARLNSNGSLDRRFGRRGRPGIVITDMDRFDQASALEPQADGKIVVSAIAGRFLGYPQSWVVLRYGRKGKLDRSFSGNGRAFPKIYGSPPAMEMQPNGRILLLGWSWEDDVHTEPFGFMLARMRNDGRPLRG